MNAADKYEDTALHFANAEVAKVLIQYGADVNAIDGNKGTALCMEQLNVDLLTLRKCCFRTVPM